MEFELTYLEMLEADKEFTHNCDREDIISAFEGVGDDKLLLEIYGKSMDELMEMVDTMAYRYRKYRYNDESWIDDRDEAIRYVLMENKKYV